MMSPDELFRFLLQYLFRGSAQPSQIFLKSSKLLIIYIPFDMKVFRIAYISFNFDFVSFIKIYGIFYLVVDKQKSRSNGVYRDGIGEFVVLGEDRVYPVAQFVHAVQVKCICSQSFDFSGDTGFLGRLAATEQADSYED